MSVRPSRKDNVISRDIAGERILVPVRGRLADMQRLFALNPVAAFMWDQIDGATTADEIVRRVCAEFDVDPQRAKQDLDEFLGQLRESGVVQEE